MCGIAGIVGLGGEDRLKLMLQATRHRGPDDQGVYSDDYATIGMNRLAIIDLTDAGHQPMYSDDGRYVLVFNGEIFNFKSLRAELMAKGIAFQSQSDSEVLLRSYVYYGKECLKRLRGMFAFAIWDNVERKLFAARDHLGIKPFLYSLLPTGVVFSSEIKGQLASGIVKREIDHIAVAEFLALGYIVPPRTILKEVKSLGPGEYLEFAHGKCTVEKYWDLKEELIDDLSEKSVMSSIRSLVYESVEEQLISDVPLGVFLSGGMDSAIVLSAMHAIGKRNIRTFSIGFDNAGAMDESTDSRRSAEFFNTDHTQFQLKGKDVSERFDGFIEGLDQPSVDGLNTYLVSEMARKEVTVSLSGLGGDELFVGYNWQTAPFGVSPLKKRIWQLAGIFKKTLPEKYGRKLDIYSKFGSPSDYYRQINRYFDDVSIAKSLMQATSADDVFFEIFDSYRPSSNDALRKLTYYDLKLFMGARLLRDNDAVAMKHSLEVRFPLIDHRLCEYAWNLPANLKLHGFRGVNGYGNRKKLLFEAFKDTLPPDLSERLKRGFKMPYHQWLKSDLSHLVDFARKSEVLNRVISKQKLNSIFKDWDEGNSSWVFVWQLIILHFWMKKYL